MGVRIAPASTPEVAPGARPTLAEAERRYIKQVLHECSGHRRAAAKILGISERNLYRKLKEFQAETEAPATA
jgi:DNA-binding NtrC family response regulator